MAPFSRAFIRPASVSVSTSTLPTRSTRVRWGSTAKCITLNPSPVAYVTRRALIQPGRGVARPVMGVQARLAGVLRAPVDAFVRWRAPEAVKMIVGVAAFMGFATYTVVYGALLSRPFMCAA